jgi:predicted naringenin-chalcone synthase
MPHALSNFRHIRPHHTVKQGQILDWLARAHALAAHPENGQEQEAFCADLKQKLFKLCGEERIQQRGIHMGDPLHENWSKMEIYPVDQHPGGLGFTERSHFYDREVTRIFERFYPDDKHLPEHLIHVTCTGYVAPSPAQKLVSLRKAGTKTTVTHAYHMGCYGSISAIRMASGFSSLPFLPQQSSVDIVHTELCTIHMNPLKHTTEHLIIQSLFADGFIKYSLTPQKPNEPHLKVLMVHEETIPDSAHSMTWRCEDKGLGMTLAKEVPVLISRALKGYLERLSQLAGVNPEELIKNSFFAIHPGGPKVLQQIQDFLKLEPYQIQHSEEVLKNYGNMSSATLPHIWEKMLNDPKVPKKGRIVSLAFGPGLSIAGGLFEKGA